MQKLIIAAMCAVLCAPVFAGSCELGKWERKRSGNTATVSGRITPGSARRVFVEIWHRDKLIAESWSYANPRGVFHVKLFADRKIKRRYRTVFSCT